MARPERTCHRRDFLSADTVRKKVPRPTGGINAPSATRR
jgi:hypothetical protein